MAFTYDPTADPADAFTLVRSDLGDIYDVVQSGNEGKGIKPYGDNFTDAEIQMALVREGGTVPYTEAVVMRAVARLCEQLARSWSRMAASQSSQARSVSYQQAKEWAERGKELRAKWGETVAVVASGAGEADTLERTDAYADAAAAEDGL